MGLAQGVYGGKVVPAPVPLGVSRGLVKRYDNPALPGGVFEVDMLTAPNDEVWIVKTVAYTYIGTAPTDIYIQLRSGAVIVNVEQRRSPTANVFYTAPYELVLAGGTTLRLTLVGATAGNRFVFDLTGYIIDV